MLVYKVLKRDKNYGKISTKSSGNAQYNSCKLSLFPSLYLKRNN